MLILVDLESFVFCVGRRVLQVRILIGLKLFVLIQIRDVLEVLILLELWGALLGCADSKGVRGEMK